MSLSREQRKLRASAAAHASHVNRTGSEATAAARRASDARFEHQADPAGVLDPAERERRARHLRAAHMKSLALKSSKARKRAAT